MRSHQLLVGQECSPLLSSLHFREEPPGLEAKEDYPLSKEELLSQVRKSVSIEKGRLQEWAGRQPFSGALSHPRLSPCNWGPDLHPSAAGGAGASAGAAPQGAG